MINTKSTIEWSADLPDLTAKIMREHYERNLDFVLSYMAEDIMWIGPLESQFISGRDKVKEFLTPEQEIPVSVSEIEFQLVSSCDTLCVVAGKLRACTRQNTGLILDVDQRYTFCWRKVEGRSVIVHIHGSNPWEFVSPEERFPLRAGTSANRILKQMVNRHNRKFAFSDVAWHKIFLEQDSIIYIESARMNSMIYYTGGTLETSQNISQVEHMMPTEFMRVHRCFLINIHHVKSIKRYVIEMDNKTEIPIPEKKYKEVRKRLEDLEKKYGGRKTSGSP